MAVSIGEAISLGLSRTGLVLFRPFRLGKWLIIAVAAALPLVGVGWPPAFTLAVDIAAQLVAQITFDDAMNWYQRHSAQVIGGMVAAVLVLFPVYLLCRWISSRGTFMFYDNLVSNEGRIAQPWRSCRELGNSLMKLWITWDLIWFNVLLLVLAAAAALALPDFRQFLATGQYTPTGWSIAALVLGLAGLIVASVALWAARAFIFLLVVPVMYVRQVPARAALALAWREVFKSNPRACLVYFLAHILIAIVKMSSASFGFIILCIVTLCLSYVMLFIPIVGNYPMALATLPVAVFEGAFQLSFLGQFGRAYQVAWAVPVEGGFPVVMDSAPVPPA